MNLPDRLRNRRRWFIPIAVIALIGAVGIGYARVRQEEGGTRTVSIAFDSDIASLDPAIGYNSRSWDVERLIFDQLLTYDSGTRLVPLLAEAMPGVSADGRTYTFRIHPDVQFVRTDGSPLRAVAAGDVAASFNRLLNPGLAPTTSPVAEAFFGNIVGARAVLARQATAASGIRVIDDHTVQFQLERPDPAFLNIVATPFGSIVPAEIAGTDTSAFSNSPIGSGPYLLQSRTAGQSMTLVRNPHYWQAGQPSLDGIDVRLGVDAAIALEQVEAGSLDLSGSAIPTGSYASVVNDPRWKNQVRSLTFVETQYMSMDTQSASALSNVLVRQAIEVAIDGDNISRITHGQGIVAKCIFPPDLPGYDPACDPYPHDVSRARALMSQAGVGGFTTKLYVTNEDPDPLIGQSIQQDLAAIGIQVQVVPQAFATWLQTIRTPDQAPLSFSGWLMDYPDSANFIDPILSCATVIPKGSNYARYCNPAVDVMADQAHGETDSQARQTRYQQIQRRIMDDAPLVPLINPSRTTLVSSRVLDFRMHPVWIYDLRSIGLKP